MYQKAMRALFQTPFTTLPYPRAAAVVSAKYRPPNQSARSSSNRIPRNAVHEEEEEGGKAGRGISGTDVLRALQRAAARKKKKVKQEKRRESSPPENRTDDDYKVDDLSEVRDLQVKSEWRSKLEELEQRLRELDDHAI